MSVALLTVITTSLAYAAVHDHKNNSNRIFLISFLYIRENTKEWGETPTFLPSIFKYMPA